MRKTDTKLSSVILFKGVRPPKPDDISPGIWVRMTKNTCSNEEITKFWLRNVWWPCAGDKRLLVWDAFTRHLTDNVKYEVYNIYNKLVIWLSYQEDVHPSCNSKLRSSPIIFPIKKSRLILQACFHNLQAKFILPHLHILAFCHVNCMLRAG